MQNNDWENPSDNSSQGGDNSQAWGNAPQPVPPASPQGNSVYQPPMQHGSAHPSYPHEGGTQQHSAGVPAGSAHYGAAPQSLLPYDPYDPYGSSIHNLPGYYVQDPNYVPPVYSQPLQYGQGQYGQFAPGDTFGSGVYPQNTPSNKGKWVWAAVIGVLVVVIILLAVALSNRKGDESPLDDSPIIQEWDRHGYEDNQEDYEDSDSDGSREEREEKEGYYRGWDAEGEAGPTGSFFDESSSLYSAEKEGESYRVGDVSYTITEVQIGKQSYVTSKDAVPRDGGGLVAVKVQVKNQGNKPISTVDDIGVHMEGKNGRAFEILGDDYDDVLWMQDDIAPGGETEGWFVFEVTEPDDYYILLTDSEFEDYRTDYRVRVNKR